MAFAVEFTRRADRDMDEHLSWWSPRGKAAADEWRARFLVKVLNSLEDDPNRFPQAEESVDLGIDLRVMLYGRRRQVYRVLFTIEGERVLVHRVRHAAQDSLKPDGI